MLPQAGQQVNGPHTASASAWLSGSGRDLGLILAVALLCRLVFFNGPFGSDDIVYLNRALEVSEGHWTSANYNGALRYGFNIPAGLFLILLGPSTFAANLWPLLCSLGEVVVVFFVGRSIGGRSAGNLGALVLAVTPLHVAVATRIHADPVVSFFLTLGFALIYFAKRSDRPWTYFAAGLSIGMVGWVKELAAVTVIAFLPILFLWGGLGRRVLPVIGGGLVMLALHLGLMLTIAGDPLHAVRVVLGAMNRNFVQGGQGEDGAAYYLRYLFVDLRHTWLLGFFALAGCVIAFRAGRRTLTGRPHAGGVDVGAVYVGVWLLALLAVLSVFPVSLSPLRFTMKQSNYITLFLAPLAVLSGLALSRLPGRARQVAVALCLAGGLALAALQQADYRAFTGNSKAAVAFAESHPDAVVIGTTNNSRIASYQAVLARRPESEVSVHTVDDLQQKGDSLLRASDGQPRPVYAVIDRQTIDWLPPKAAFGPAAPGCWKEVETLVARDLALSNALLDQFVLPVFARLPPGRISSMLSARFGPLAKPKPATVYSVPAGDLSCTGAR